MNDSDAYDLALAFDNDDERFALGVEVGHVWTALSYEQGETTIQHFEYTVHVANAEMMIRIAEAQEMHVSSEEIGDGWMRVTFTEEPQ